MNTFIMIEWLLACCNCILCNLACWYNFTSNINFTKVEIKIEIEIKNQKWKQELIHFLYRIRNRNIGFILKTEIEIEWKLFDENGIENRNRN